ncbi:MAG TPA: hypothetical protein VLX85_16560 [Stellaceae bacterium]|nr:hypothetical protein [Stellaceae bacterium]
MARPSGTAAQRGIFYNLRRNIAAMLDPEQSAKPARAVRRERTPGPMLAPLAARDDDDFETRLRGLLSENSEGALLAGRVNVIGLKKVKERFGAEWDRFAVRADRIARNTIERHLTAGDIYTSTLGFAYIMVFAQLSPDQAKVKCRLIGDEIAKSLLGEGDGALIEVKTAVAQIDGKIAFQDVLLKEVLATSLGDDKDLELVDEPAPRRPVQAPDGQWEPIPAPARKQNVRGAQADLLDDLRFVYRPMWDQSRSVVSAYYCVAQVPLADVGDARGDAETMTGDGGERPRLDVLTQQRVIADLDDLARASRKLFIVLPVHFETLSAMARRREYLRVLREQTNAEMRKLLVVEVVGVPQGVPQTRLTDLVGPLKPLCRSVVLRLPLESADFSNIKGSGAEAIGADVAGRADAEFVLMQHMNRFARATAKAEFPCYIHGLRSISLVAGALGAGFGYIDGDAVASPVAHPRGVVEFRLADLYRSFIKS